MNLVGDDYTETENLALDSFDIDLLPQVNERRSEVAAGPSRQNVIGALSQVIF